MNFVFGVFFKSNLIISGITGSAEGSLFKSLWANGEQKLRSCVTFGNSLTPLIIKFHIF